MTCPPNKPVFVILGGPNGAGKTTGALSILPFELRILHFVNADLIARGLSPLAPALADFDAARMMLQRMRELQNRHENFAVETTLASKTLVPFLRKCKMTGYETRLIFVALDNPETAIRRVAIRVAKGGHDIPEETVRRRFVRGLRNFFDVYRNEVDNWTLLDNSGSCWKIVAVKDNQTGQRVFDADIWQNLEGQSKNETRSH
ncbi:MAG: zeta toxin family protein [Planctomycetaceae bacterium]|nr:zeta toxin family protein [Planctomycetaceae bacterium]